MTVRGTSLSATTDEQGNFSIDCVESGPVTLDTSASGYSPRTDSATIVSQDTVYISIALVPLVACDTGNGPITIVLTWGESPRDLDSHMSGPDAGGGDRFHMAYFNRDPEPYVSLDVDDTTSYGPETTTITPTSGSTFAAGDYHFWVHNFSGESSFSGSQGVVTVSQCGQQLAQFPVSAASGDPTMRIWNVLSMGVAADGTVTITTVQTFQEGDSGTVL